MLGPSAMVDEFHCTNIWFAAKATDHKFLPGNSLAPLTLNSHLSLLSRGRSLQLCSFAIVLERRSFFRGFGRRTLLSRGHYSLGKVKTSNDSFPYGRAGAPPPGYRPPPGAPPAGFRPPPGGPMPPGKLHWLRHVFGYI